MVGAIILYVIAGILLMTGLMVSWISLPANADVTGFVVMGGFFFILPLLLMLLAIPVGRSVNWQMGWGITILAAAGMVLFSVGTIAIMVFSDASPQTAQLKAQLQDMGVAVVPGLVSNVVAVIVGGGLILRRLASQKAARQELQSTFD